MRKFTFPLIKYANKIRSHPISVQLSLLILTAASLLTALGLFVLQPKTVLIWSLIAESNGLIFLLNWLPVYLLMMLLYFATGNLVIACGFGAMTFIAPAFVNRYMIAWRQTPLRPFDMMLGMEFLGTLKSNRKAVYDAAGGGLAFFITLITLGVIFIKNSNPPALYRVLCGLACLLVMGTLFFSVYGNASIHANLPIEGSVYSEAAQYQSKGFVYSFLHTWRNSRIVKPKDYDRFKTIIEAKENLTPMLPASEKLPNIIMVQSEAFSDLSLSDAVNFDGHDDPLRFFKEIKKESIYGYLVSPHLGGGTSDMEFDILTGINTRDFRSVPYSFTLITKPDAPGFVRVLSQVGYGTLAMHPGAGWFYNRQNVYPMLGFDGFLYENAFNKTMTKGGYITESHTFDVVLQAYEDRPSDPFFLNAITVQNHGPYFEKYHAGINFNTQADLSAIDMDSLANYFEGVKDCDTQLERLVTYFRARPEPVVLIFYGDHLPSLPLSIYQALIPETEAIGDSLIRFNRVPFIIWTNKAARSLPLLNTQAFEASLLPDLTISSFYFGAAILEMLRLDTRDSFLHFINSLREDYPISLEITYRQGAGPFQLYNPDEAEELALYKSWAYHRIMNP